MRLTGPATIAGTEHVRQQGVRERRTPDPAIAHRGVGHLVAHREGPDRLGISGVS
jgi:hypothetical protein